MENLSNRKIHDETKSFIKACIKKEEFCDVTIAFKDGKRSCTTLFFLLAGKFWKDLIRSVDGHGFSTIIVPDIDVSCFETMIKLLLDGFATIYLGEKEAVKDDVKAFFPNVPTRGIFDVDDDSNICKFCLKEFSRKEHRIHHEKTCTISKRYSCSKCSKTFNSIHAKNVHEKRHDVENFHFVCPECGKCFRHHQNLLRHIKSKEHDYPSTDVYPGSKKLTKDADVICDICHRYVKRLDHHKKTHHSKNNRLFSCSMCEFETDRSDTLSTHQYLKHKMTNRKFSKLDETFKDGNPNYECPECKSKFDNFADIEKHLLLKNCEEIKCKICKKSFKQRKNLNQHVRNVHESTEVFKCVKCGKVYSHKRSLEKHTVICNKK